MENKMIESSEVKKAIENIKKAIKKIEDLIFFAKKFPFHESQKEILIEIIENVEDIKINTIFLKFEIYYKRNINEI